MPAITASYVITHPSYIMPEMMIKINQASGAFDTLAGGDPMPRLSEGDLYAYIKYIDVRTKVAAGQQAFNQLPSVSLTAQMISTPSYLFRNRAEYDHHDTAAAGQWGIGLPEAQRLGMRQGIFQHMRSALLFGVNATNGEGLLNTVGATVVPLPPDSNGNDTVLSYDNGQMAVFFLQQIAAIKTRTMSLGIPQRIVILGPQRTLSTFEYQNIVQVTQFQRIGAGSATTADVVKLVAEMNGDTIEWNYDDTLQGAGPNGTDIVIITIPEVQTPHTDRIDTNDFARLTPNLKANNLMLCDMAAPREIPSPLAGGAVDVVSELRCTSGWVLRPDGLTITQMAYSS